MYTENEVTQVGRAVLALRELILKGQFAAGGRLSEPQLVARLGISRSPVAEAVAREHAQLSRRNLQVSLIDEDIRNYVPGSSLILA